MPGAIFVRRLRRYFAEPAAEPAAAEPAAAEPAVRACGGDLQRHHAQVVLRRCLRLSLRPFWAPWLPYRFELAPVTCGAFGSELTDQYLNLIGTWLEAWIQLPPPCAWYLT